MKVALLTAPGLSPFSPPLSVLSLASYLQLHGVDVLALDISIDFLHYALNPDSLAQRFVLSQKAARAILRHDNGPDTDLTARLRRLAASYDPILAFFRDAWTLDGWTPGGLRDCTKSVDAITDALFFLALPDREVTIGLDVKTSLRSFALRGISRRWKWNDHGSLFPGGALLAEYCRTRVLPALERFKPDLLGLSISYTAQAQTACEMLQSLAAGGRTPIVVGGSFFHYLWDHRKVTLAPDDASYSNVAAFLHPYGVLGEGERPLLELCRRLEKKKPPNDVAGLFYHDGPRVRLNEPGPPLHPDELPLIDLARLRMGKYLSPIRIAPLMTSRGCYWRRCAFCEHAEVIQSAWRESDPEVVCENIERYRNGHGVEFVMFCDESTSPKMLQSLIRLLPARRLGIEFATMARFEKAIAPMIGALSRAGCRFLSLGLESASQRVLNLMDKGITVDDAEAILTGCKQHGVMTEVFVMFGFPGETISEAAETLQFLEKHADSIYVLRATSCVIRPNSPMGRDLRRCPSANGRPMSASFARALALELSRNPALAGKVINGWGDDLRHEEFHIIRHLQGRARRGL